MKKQLFITLLFFFSIQLFSQEQYKSKSGYVFKVGDSIKLGQPVKISSSPLIATSGEWTSIYTMKGKNLENMNFINKSAVIKKIDLEDDPKLYFELYRRTFYALIDKAVDNSEIIIPKLPTNNKYDNLKKLKELLDMGAINEEEFEKEKNKILMGK